MESNPKDIVLEEEIDDDYKPTEEEILEYATWLGMDLSKHQELLWIAQESLTSCLPDEWKPCLTEEDEIYYFNFTTGESLWNHPCDEFYRNLYDEKAGEIAQHQDSPPTFQVQKLQNSTSNNFHAYHKDTQWNDKDVGSTFLLGSMTQLGKRLSQSPENTRGLVMSKKQAASSQEIAKDLIANSSSKAGWKSYIKSFSDPILSVGSLYPLEKKSITRSLPVNQISRINNGLIADKFYLRKHMPTYRRSCSLPFFQLPAKADRKRNGLLQAPNGVSASELVQHSQLENYSLSKGIIEKSTGEAASEKELLKQGIDSQVKHLGQDKEKNKITDDRVSHMQDRIKSKILEEEHIVLQQERIEMIERVGQLVQVEESQLLESLKQEMFNEVENQVKSEAEAILADRRKEMYKEVEIELQAETKLLSERRKMLDEEKVPVNAQVATVQAEKNKTFDEQLKLERQKQKDHLQNLFQKERELFESEKRQRFQEMSKILEEDESKLMEKERQEAQKRVNKAIEEEESILFENMRSKMEARIKQQVKKMETAAFEKEYEYFVKRIRGQVEQKYKDLLDAYKNQMDTQFFIGQETPSNKQESEDLKTSENFIEHESPKDTPKRKQGNIQEIKEINLEIQPVTKKLQEMRKKLNSFRGNSAALTISNDMELKQQISQCIAEFKELSLRQKIRDEILQLVQEGVLSKPSN